MDFHAFSLKFSESLTQCVNVSLSPQLFSSDFPVIWHGFPDSPYVHPASRKATRGRPWPVAPLARPWPCLVQAAGSPPWRAEASQDNRGAGGWKKPIGKPSVTGCLLYSGVTKTPLFFNNQAIWMNFRMIVFLGHLWDLQVLAMSGHVFHIVCGLGKLLVAPKSLPPFTTGHDGNDGHRLRGVTGQLDARWRECCWMPWSWNVYLHLGHFGDEVRII